MLHRAFLAKRLAAAAGRWLAHRPAYMLLTADAQDLAAEPPARFARAWLELMGLSVLWGAALTNAWGLTWHIFSRYDYDMLVVPALAAAGVFCLWPCRRGVVALAEVLGGRDATARAMAAAMIVFGAAMCLLCLKPDWGRWEYLRLPWWLDWLRPPAKLYRVLFLMPVWGAWSMVITPKFARPSDRTEPQVAAMAAGCPAHAAAACMVFPLVFSIAYFHHLGLGSQASISLVTILAAILGGAGLCRLTGGLTRRALLAANVVTQIAFALAYLAGR